MALVLALRMGDPFFVRGEKFSLSGFNRRHGFSLTDGKGNVYKITNQDAVEIADDVYVSAGDGAPSSTARVVISAPREVQITRGEKQRSRSNRREAL